LIAPDSDNNPWHYKFSWNPRNVVLAGQAGPATFLAGGADRLVPPHRVFQNARIIEVGGTSFEGYPNRDSIAYVEKYGLGGIQTLVRGTLRGEGFCAGWDALVQLGCVRDDVKMNWSEDCSWADWLRSFVPAQWAEEGLESAVRRVTNCSDESMKRLKWLGLFDAQLGPKMTSGTPAQIIQELLEVKWELKAEDRDMIVMWHRFLYELNGERHEVTSSLRLEGRDAVYTGMSDTVGWPMAIAAEAMLNDRFKQTGVAVPLHRDYYAVILPELERMGVVFQETHRTC
jgi:saccharopine dehydrogenase-like NADP-dependent oxidoreductase